MRAEFSKALLDQALKNDKIVLLTGDLGYIMWDEFQHLLPNQYVNCGASEQAMMDIAVGLAYQGKIPFVYSITPFLLYRPFETVRTYIDHEKLNVKLVGSGRDTDYAHDGYSHNAEDTGKILSALPNIVQMWPKDKESIPSIVSVMVKDPRPMFISLKR
jgi:transketolase